MKKFFEALGICIVITLLIASIVHGISVGWIYINGLDIPKLSKLGIVIGHIVGVIFFLTHLFGEGEKKTIKEPKKPSRKTPVRKKVTR